MSKLSEYNPLRVIELAGATIKNPKGLVVVVGPNSSGKTLFLRDIRNYLTTGNPQFVVCRAMAANKPDNPKVLLADLVERGYVQSVPGHDQTYRNYLPTLLPTNDAVAKQLQLNFNLRHFEEGFGTKFQTEM